ncbi:MULTISPECIES: cell envelope integrity protein TolA [Lysobacter]|jgi:colicin import membrane protein|uniref:Cell envelope integrity protein TolA n=1 Tax=Lysobacter gummosus TaxID=262324 RepID=A0ABY3X7B7_9GAMM|nr:MULTISPECIES: cell envelope integrity protein TolA [Lysobacter]ALN92922.1 protein TolA [Lysobacter gummosus]UJB20281.1 cell envelope integrity protein TolA [Lysobacter capsici]UJQ30605.1 cell envelope integrity protein TolA [Lysobacter gummosus]UNP28468.1 cell envelope integrity protein TolA [Lysobacter gummosus]
MRETRADTVQAVIVVVLLHGLLIVAIFLSMLWNWQSEQVAAAGSPISSELTDISDLSAAMQRTLRNRPKPVETLPTPEPEDAAPLPQPIPEPKPQDAPAPQQQAPQDFIPVPDDTSQEQVVDTPTPNRAEEQKVQEAKARQEQVDLTEQKRQEEAQQQQRLAAEQQEKLKELEKIRAERAKLQKQTNLAEQKLQQLADARAANASQNAASPSPSQPAGNEGVDAGLAARYAAALQSAIVQKWTRPDTVPIGAGCRLNIRQLPGGNVISVEVVEPCGYDEQGRRSIEAAVLKAQPLPYAGFEKVFSRNLNLNFKAEDR